MKFSQLRSFGKRRPSGFLAIRPYVFIRFPQIDFITSLLGRIDLHTLPQRKLFCCVLL